jgi:hypothetical protein
MKTGWRFASQNAYGRLKVRQPERRRSPALAPWISPKSGKPAFLKSIHYLSSGAIAKPSRTTFARWPAHRYGCIWMPLQRTCATWTMRGMECSAGDDGWINGARSASRASALWLIAGARPLRSQLDPKPVTNSETAFGRSFCLKIDVLPHAIQSGKTFACFTNS